MAASAAVVAGFLGSKSAPFYAGKRKDCLSRLCFHVSMDWLHTAGAEFMNKLVEIRNQEFICRERASLDSERRIFWLAKAKEWEQYALDVIAFHFRECNRGRADSQTGTHY
jgi:hypothetical protein